MTRMKAMFTATVLGASLATAAWAGQAASSSRSEGQQDRNKQTTVTGCLEKNNSGGYWLTKTSLHAAGTPGSTTPGTTTTPGATTPGSTAPGTTTTPGATPSQNRGADDKNMNMGVVYNLEGGKDLQNHVGHRIEVTGRLDDDASADKPKGATSDKEVKARDFHVEAMKMLSATCS